MRLARAGGFVFGVLALGALVATIVVAEAYPDESEGLGLLFWLIACTAGLLAAACGLIVGVRGYGIHQTRIGRPAMIIIGVVLLVWLGRTLVHI